MENVYQVVTAVARPFTLALIIAIVTVAIMIRRKEAGRRGLVALLVLLVFAAALCTPLVGLSLLGLIERNYPPSDRPAAAADTLAVLAGGMIVNDGRAEMAPDTAMRCIHALRLYRQAGRCRMVLCGGKIAASPDPAVAETMRDFLLDAGVNPGDLVVDDKSLTTYENALCASELLGPLDVRQIVLVTDASHMSRASRCFRKFGFEVIPSPCNRHATDVGRRPTDYLPGAEGLAATEQVGHEWFGTVWYWLKDRI